MFRYFSVSRLALNRESENLHLIVDTLLVLRKAAGPPALRGTGGLGHVSLRSAGAGHSRLVKRTHRIAFFV
jgi:hypothetical protein